MPRKGFLWQCRHMECYHPHLTDVNNFLLISSKENECKFPTTFSIGMNLKLPWKLEGKDQSTFEIRIPPTQTCLVSGMFGF
jgi:hypothetical protein